MVNIDETGHPENGQKLWTWGFHVPGEHGFTLFPIDPSRSSEVLRLGQRPPRRADAQNIRNRFRKHADRYFRFLQTAGIEPTNNAMEQRFRFVAIDRRITQGTRGETGRQWSERIWTALTTCVQQGRSAFAFLERSIAGFFLGTQAPSLIASPP